MVRLIGGYHRSKHSAANSGIGGYHRSEHSLGTVVYTVIQDKSNSDAAPLVKHAGKLVGVSGGGPGWSLSRDQRTSSQDGGPSGRRKGSDSTDEAG